MPGGFYGNDDYLGSIGNSNYNALQVSVKSSTKRLAYSLAYTYSKSIDQSSSMADVLDPFNFEATRALSAWNLTHDFVATYDIRLPLELLTQSRRARFLQGWELSGITRVSTGFPVTLSTSGDNSLQGSSPNGVNNRYLDLPDATGAPLDINSNPQRMACTISIRQLSPITHWARSETLLAVIFPGLDCSIPIWRCCEISRFVNPKCCSSAWKLSTFSIPRSSSVPQP